MATIELPTPPSVNALYRAVKGRSILSATYRRWKDEAGAALLSQRPEKHPGPVHVTVAIRPKDKRRRDIDNTGFKAVLDLLTAHQIIVDDDSRYVRSISAHWADEGPECLVTITPAELPELAFNQSKRRA
jgi:crossover junction endodeoxyribonuclease RusA